MLSTHIVRLGILTILLTSLRTPLTATLYMYEPFSDSADSLTKLPGWKPRSKGEAIPARIVPEISLKWKGLPASRGGHLLPGDQTSCQKAYDLMRKIKGDVYYSFLMEIDENSLPEKPYRRPCSRSRPTLIQALNEKDMKFSVIGQGSNLVISDKGLNCAAIRFCSETPNIRTEPRPGLRFKRQPTLVAALPRPGRGTNPDSLPTGVHFINCQLLNASVARHINSASCIIKWILRPTVTKRLLPLINKSLGDRTIGKNAQRSTFGGGNRLAVNRQR